MFENIVAFLLNKYLGKYVDNLDSEQLNVGIFSGTVQLTDLKLKPDALYELDLPIVLKAGCIGKVSIDIPWLTLYWDPVLVHLEDILILASPISDDSYDQEVEKKLQRAKKKKLFEDLQEPVQDPELAAQSLGFFENLTATIVNNVQISVQNIHVRYEDKTSDSEHTVALGAALQSMTAITTNSKWKPTQIDGASTSIFKLIKLECFSIYCNPTCHPDCLATSMISSNYWKNPMKKALATFSMDGDEFDFIVKPVSAKLKMIFNKSAEENVPKLLLDFVVQDAATQLSRDQYLSIFKIADSFKRIEVSRQFLRYKTTSTETPRTKWHFAYKAILEEYIRPASWPRILEHRKKYRQYKDLYVELLHQPNNIELKLDLQKLEDSLDVVTIIIAREKAKDEVIKAQPELLTERVKKKPLWSLWMESEEEEPETVVELLGEREKSLWARLTPEEKEKIKESVASDPTSTSPQYIAHKLNFTLANFTLSLLHTNHEILVVTLTQFLTSLETRPEAKAFKLSARTESFVVEGASGENELVPIMTADNVTSGNSLANVFALDLEKNPLYVQAGFGLTINAEPMEVVYQEKAISEMIAFFQLPTITVNEMKSLATKHLISLAKSTRSGLEYAINTRQTINISVDLKSPYIVVPEFGSLQKAGSVIVIDMGRLIVNSDLQPDLTNLEDNTKMELEEKLYDRFNVLFTDIQILFCDSGDEWRVCKQKPESDLHLVPKMKIQLLFSNSINPDYKNMPKQKLNVSIASFKLNLSDRRVRMLMEFIHNLPLPKAVSEDIKPEPLDPLHAHLQLTKDQLKNIQNNVISKLSNNLALTSRTSSMQSLHGVEDGYSSCDNSEHEEEWARVIDLPGFEDNVSPNNGIQILLRFSLGEIVVHLQRSGDHKDKPYLMLRLEKICVDLASMEYGPALQASLGSIQLVDKLHPGPYGEYLELISSQSTTDMITVLYRKVRSNCPDFKTHFHQVEHSLVIDLNVVSLIFHREAFRTLGRFLQYVLTKVKQKDSSKLIESVIQMQFPEPSYLLVDPQLDPPVPHGATKYSISARVDNVQVRLCDTELDLAEIQIKGLECDYILKANEKMIVKVNLSELLVENLMENTLYTKILTIEDDKVFDLKYVRHSAPPTKDIDSDASPSKWDGTVKLKMGRLHFVFLYKFFAELQRFFEPFINPKLSQTARKSAINLVNSKARELKQTGLKLQLNIDIHAPTILLPQKSTSCNLLVLSLGDFSVENFFSSNHQIDNILVRLDNLHMARAITLLDGTIQTQESIIQPVKIRLDIKRALPPISREVLLFDIHGTMDTIEINVGQRDLATILAVYEMNIAEGQVTEIQKSGSSPTSPLEPITPSVDVRRLEAFLSSTSEVIIETSVSFILEGVVIVLYTDEEEVLSSPVRDPGKALSRLEVDELSASLILYADRALEVKCSLQAATLEDVRPDSTLALRKIFQSYSGDNQFGTGIAGISISMPPMVDFTYKQTSNGDAAVDIVIEKTRLNISIPYFLSIGRFIMNSLPPQTVSNPVPLKPTRLMSDSTSGYHSNFSSYSEEAAHGLSISAVLKKTEIILFADPSNLNSQVVVLKTDVMLDLSHNLGQNNIVVSLTGLHVLSCFYAHRKQTMTTVLENCDVEFSRSNKISEDEVRMIASLSNLHLCFTPPIIRTLTKVGMDLISSLQETKQTKEPEYEDESSDLWAPKRITGSKWLNSIAQECAKPTYPSKPSNQETFTISIPEIQVVGQLEQKIPVLLIKGAMSGDIHDWSQQMYLMIDFQLEIMYFNEKVSTWEPLLEPMMESEGQYRPWEVLIKAFKENSHPIYCNEDSDTMFVTDFSEPDGRSSCHGTVSDESTSDDESAEEMTVIKRHHPPRPKRLPSVKSHDSSSLLAYPQDSDSENEDGILEKIAATFGHLFSEENSEEDGAHSEGENVEQVKSDSGDTETADNDQSITDEFPMFISTGKGEDGIDGLVAEEIEEITMATYIIIDSRDHLEVNLTHAAISAILDLITAFTSPTPKSVNSGFKEKKQIIDNYLGPEAGVTLFTKADNDQYMMVEEVLGHRGSPASTPSISLPVLPLVDVSPAESDSEIPVDELDGFSIMTSDVTSSVELPTLPYRDTLTVSNVYSQTVKNKIAIQVNGFEKLECFVPSRANSRMYALQPMLNKTRYYIVVNSDIHHGVQKITVSSPLKVFNHLNRALNIFCQKSLLEAVGGTASDYSKNPFHETYIRLATLEPDQELHLPLLVAYHHKLFLQPVPHLADLTGFDISTEGVWWQDVNQRSSKMIVCPSESDTRTKFSINVYCMENKLVESPSVGTKLVPNYTLHLHPPIMLHNSLPYPVDLNFKKSGIRFTLEEGEKYALVDIEPGRSQEISIEIAHYCGIPWQGVMEVLTDIEEHKAIQMQSDCDIEKHLSLSVAVQHNPNTDVHLFSPYWIINKTGLPLQLRGASSDTIYESTSEEPLLFRYKKHKKKKAKLRVYESRWSQSFCLDTVGNSGVIVCVDKTRNKKYRLHVDISLSSNQLTKFIVIKPYFLVMNQTSHQLRFMEENEQADLWMDIGPSNSLPFWPDTDSLKLSVKLRDSQITSQHFPIDRTHTTVLRMDQGKQGLVVRVDGAPSVISFESYTHGDAVVRVDNFCEDLFFKINQKSQSQVTLLSPYQSVLYTWDDPALERTLVWNLYNRKKCGFPAHINKDGFGCEKLTFCTLPAGNQHSKPALSSSDDDDSDFEDTTVLPRKTRKDKVIVYWVSYLEDRQRVLLFTQDERVARQARKDIDGEKATLEIYFSFSSLGVSIINQEPREIAYVGLDSSPAVWELEINHSWKLLTLELSAWLEDKWRAEQTVATLKDYVQVDLSKMQMSKPIFGKLRRTYTPAFWCQYRRSLTQNYIYLKLHRLQLDNQLPDAVFPVAVYPMPTPLSIVRRNGSKPFLELGLLTHQAQNMLTIRYLKLLVQEVNIRIDKGFVLSLVDMATVFFKEPDEKESMKKDIEKLRQPLFSEDISDKEPEQKVMFEFIHLSPLKVNFSFSPRGTVHKASPEPWTFKSDIIDLLLNSIGATLTEMKDVELKMAYFEKKGVVITASQMLSDAKSHYICQTVQQAYVLILGLDVLGNPYGLIKDFTTGITDFFYEPFLGVIQGPEEFAEGFVRGAQSLLGHVIGGTASSISLITGSLGHVLSTLSFDEDYRKKRRIRLQQHPQSLPETLFIAGKGFVLGVALGLSGVVVKPITGAQQEGLEGFFKGVGKGLMGLLTKPAGGVVDMVSMAFDGIRRAAELGEHVVVRLRLPRFINPCQGLRPFSPFQASGQRLLAHLSKGHYSDTDIYWAHAALSKDDHTEVAMVADRHLFLLEKCKFWGGWSIEWIVHVDDIMTTPQVCGRKLTIQVRQEELSTSFSGNKRYYQSDDSKVLAWLKTKIEMVQTLSLENKPCPQQT